MQPAFALLVPLILLAACGKNENPQTASVAAVGEDTYRKVCAICHAGGTAGAPRLGSKDDWAPRLAQGRETLYQRSITGFTGAKGVMPPKGGNPALSDAQVKAAVDYMVDKAK